MQQWRTRIPIKLAFYITCQPWGLHMNALSDCYD